MDVERVYVCRGGRILVRSRGPASYLSWTSTTLQATEKKKVVPHQTENDKTSQTSTDALAEGDSGSPTPSPDVVGDGKRFVT